MPFNKYKSLIPICSNIPGFVALYKLHEMNDEDVNQHFIISLKSELVKTQNYEHYAIVHDISKNINA